MVYVRLFLFISSVILLVNYAHANSTPTITCDFKSNDGVVLLESSKDRINNKERCFEKEYKIIKERRRVRSSIKAPVENSLNQIVGLGLSGGGIKSSAFQLGLLSGLHNSRSKQGASLLNEIDYISSVSGGSWANGAYMAAPESDDVLFNCLDETVAESSKQECREFDKLLPDSQSQFKGSRDWHMQIVDYFLRGNDVKLETLRKKSPPFSNRPFPIFMATHSNTIIGKKSIKNFPFEITPLHVGAIADCNSPEAPCGFFRRYFRPLHWNNPPEKGFVIDLAEGKKIDTVVKKYIRNPQNDLGLSHAMWASGGLVAKVLSLHLRLSIEGKKIPGVRKKYVLSDGGKTDNLGLVPLVERGADLIILSQIASDAELKFGDLERSAGQVEKLFGLNVDTHKLISPHNDESKKRPFITTSCVKNGQEGILSLWLIKPTTENVVEFYDYLKKSGKYGKLLSFLETEEKPKKGLERFPQNPTLKFNYPKKLIYAYYALGKYIGEMKLSPAIKDWLKNGSQCVKNTPQQ